jgi:hypothetical protein
VSVAGGERATCVEQQGEYARVVAADCSCRLQRLFKLCVHAACTPSQSGRKGQQQDWLLSTSALAGYPRMSSFCHGTGCNEPVTCPCGVFHMLADHQLLPDVMYAAVLLVVTHWQSCLNTSCKSSASTGTCP